MAGSALRTGAGSATAAGATTRRLGNKINKINRIMMATATPRTTTIRSISKYHKAFSTNTFRIELIGRASSHKSSIIGKQGIGYR